MKKIMIYENGVGHEATLEEIAERQTEAETSAEEENRKYWSTISYDDAVNDEIRKRYPQQSVEAIINKYLSSPENTEYVREFLELQEYRAQCKAYAREMKEKYEQKQAAIV